MGDAGVVERRAIEVPERVGRWHSGAVTTTSAPTALFVYGTLMPGHLRWRMLEPHVVDRRSMRVPGILYDTGNGWPAAVFRRTGPERTIPGWVVWIRPETEARLLAELDEMEGIGPEPDPEVDVFERIRVRIDGVSDAWAYHATSVPRHWRPIDSWMDQPES